MAQLKSMNAGKSLRMLMERRDISCEELQGDLGISATTVSKLRKKKLMSGKNVVLLS
ncbi:MAG: helix-turn-helix domain-containing protein, partial [Alteromonadales bacterium]|nr:helix-turn-helix domain-containing protein [Alteromonadales bacterium]